MNTTPLLIARRLGIGRHSPTGRSATGVTVAVTGIALSIVVMMVAMAVMKGFKSEIGRKVTGFEAQITIQTPTHGADLDAAGTSLVPSPIAITPPLRDAIMQLAAEGNDMEVWLSAVRPMMLKTDDNFMGVVARGIDSPTGLRFIRGNIIDGTMPDFEADSARNDVVISSVAASALNLSPGDKVQAYFFGDSNVRVRRLTVAAIYDTRFIDYDKIYAFTSLKLLQSVDKLDADQGTRIELSGIADKDVDNASARLNTLLLDNIYTGRDSILYQIENVHHRGAIYFNWLELLDTNVDVIMALMAVVAGFTLISSLFIIILERVRTIGILKSLGASNSFVRRIFILLAERIVLRGMLIGNITAAALLFLQWRWHIMPLDPDTYYLSYIPVEIAWSDVLWLNIGVVVVSLIVLVVPSQLASTISPARTMRYE